MKTFTRIANITFVSIWLASMVMIMITLFNIVISFSIATLMESIKPLCISTLIMIFSGNVIKFIKYINNKKKEQ